MVTSESGVASKVGRDLVTRGRCQAIGLSFLHLVVVVVDGADGFQQGNEAIVF